MRGERGPKPALETDEALKSKKSVPEESCLTTRAKTCYKHLVLNLCQWKLEELIGAPREECWPRPGRGFQWRYLAARRPMTVQYKEWYRSTASFIHRPAGSRLCAMGQAKSQNFLEIPISGQLGDIARDESWNKAKQELQPDHCGLNGGHNSQPVILYLFSCFLFVAEREMVFWWPKVGGCSLYLGPVRSKLCPKAWVWDTPMFSLQYQTRQIVCYARFK